MPSSPVRARKVDRACDGCRRRKSRCDGPSQSDRICSSCRGQKACTYLEASTPRGPPKAYITGLEDRLEQLEELLHRVRPDADFSTELGPPVARGSWKEDYETAVADSSRRQLQQSPPRTSLKFSSHLALNSYWQHDLSDSDGSDEFDSSDSEDMAEGIKCNLRDLTAENQRDLEPLNARFHGKSSLFTLIDMTRRYKRRHLSEAGHSKDDNVATFEELYTATRRSQFWTCLPWEKQWEGCTSDNSELLASVNREFPPDKLATELIDIYFVHTNSQLPLLHRPTFEQQFFRDKLHQRHIWFACVCLSMFAVASRWSNDPLVLPRNFKRTSTGELDWASAGWHYYSVAMEIHRARQSLLYPVILEEVQTFSLLACFLRGTANHPHPSAGWIFVSLGLRKAQDVGAHRKKVYQDTPSVEEELWRRAVWCLIAYDRFGSAILGRPCASGEEEFDLDSCLEVDDAYWHQADRPFQQPSDVPCRITYFNLWLRLSQIVTYTVKTIYAIHNPRALLGRIAKVRTDEVVAQLTHALKDWSLSVPDYLRWSPDIEDDELANQSASLTTTYYLAEMLIYRAFIPPVKMPNSPATPVHHINFSIPALSYCIQAARSCTRIIEVQFRRGWTNVTQMTSAAQLAAAILTLAVWDAKGKEGSFEDVKPPPAQTIGYLMDDIGILLGVLEWAAHRWENARTLLTALKDALPKEEADRAPQPPAELPTTILHSLDEQGGTWSRQRDEAASLENRAQHVKHASLGASWGSNQTSGYRSHPEYHAQYSEMQQ
ncbi:Zn(2)-C6 fungal-type domain-containing protein [Mycena kentingensis (nom. inval.)]|nr:Zn(2)-C6 fungal-type domain-containing protein [Mycena kentingensis (nom. inval.)]